MAKVNIGRIEKREKYIKVQLNEKEARLLEELADAEGYASKSAVVRRLIIEGHKQLAKA